MENQQNQKKANELNTTNEAATIKPSSPLPGSHDEIANLEMQKGKNFEGKSKIREINQNENQIEPSDEQDFQISKNSYLNQNPYLFKL